MQRSNQNAFKSETELTLLRRRISELENQNAQQQAQLKQLQGVVNQHRVLATVTPNLFFVCRFTTDELLLHMWTNEPQFKETTGYTFDEVNRRGGWLTLVHPKDRAKALRYYQNLQHSHANHIKYRLVNKHGNTLWLQEFAHSLPTERAVVGIRQNITPQEKTKSALQEQKRKYNQMVDLVQEGIWLMNDKEIITFVNPRMAQMLGYSIEEIVGKHFSYLFRPNISNRTRQKLLRRQPDARERLECELRHKNGSLLQVTMETAPVIDEERCYNGALTTVINITRYKRIESDYQQLLTTERTQRLLTETLRDVTLSLIGHTSPEAVLDEILLQARRLVPYNTANIFLLEGESLRLARSHGFQRFDPSTNIRLNSRKIDERRAEREAIEFQKAIVISDTHNDPSWMAYDRNDWVRSHLIVPICHRPGVLGILQLDSNIPGQYTAADIEYLEPLTNAAAIALENARLYEQIRRDADTKEILLREVNHRVSNNLTAISGMLSLERNHLTDIDRQAYQAIMEDLTNRVNGLSTVHTMLSASEWSPLPLHEVTRRVICSSLKITSARKNVRVEVTPGPVYVTSDQAHNLALILNELTTNSVKYAMQKQNSVKISVNFYTLDNGKKVQLEFKDNGPGYPEEVLHMKRHNVGLDLVKNMMRRNLRGNWQLYNKNGAVTALEFDVISVPENTKNQNNNNHQKPSLKTKTLKSF